MNIILIVDDDENNRELVKAIFKGSYQVLEAADAKTALTLAKLKQPDIIITDIQMPKMNGIDFIKKIREDNNLKNVTVMFYTSMDYIADASLMAIGCGVPYVLQKPCSPEIIIKAVETALNLKKMEKNPLPDDTLTIYATELKQIQKMMKEIAKREHELAEARTQLNILLSIVTKEKSPKADVKEKGSV